MAITPLPTPPSRSQSPATFSTDADAFLGALPAFATEANALATDVNADEASAAASATTASNAASIAVGAANYQGNYNAGTTYQIGQSVSSGGRQWVAKTVNTGITPVEGANWLLINDGDVLGPVSATNNALVLYDGTSGKIIKSGLNNGTAGQALLSGGSGNAPVWGNLSASTIEAIASGSITAGQPVSMLSNGTVAAVTGFTQAETTGAEATATTSGNNYSTSFAIPNTNKIAVTYILDSDAYPYAVIGDVSGSTITFGTPVRISNVVAYATSTSISYDPVNNRILFAWSTGSSNQTYSVSASISGTTLAFGTVTQFFNTAQAGSLKVYYDATAACFVMLGTYAGTTFVRTFTLSGSSIVQQNSSSYSGVVMSGCHGPSYGVAVHYANGGAGTAIYSRTITVNPGATYSITLGSASLLQSTAGSIYYADISYSNDLQRFFVIYNDTAIGGGYLFCMENAANSAIGSVIITTAGFQQGQNVFYDAISQKVFVMYRVNSGNVFIRVYNFSANSFSLDVEKTNFVYSSNWQSAGLVSGGKIFVGYINSGYKARIYMPYVLSTNASNYVGLAKTAASNGQSVTVTIVGGTNTSVTGLTANTSYYVTFDGQISTTGYARIGRALSATSILVEDRLASSGLPSSSTFLRGDGAWGTVTSTVTLIASGTNPSSVSNLVVNNISTAGYSSIIFEISNIDVEAAVQLYFGLVAPAGVSASGTFYASYIHNYSNSSTPTGNIYSGSTIPLNPFNTGGSSKLAFQLVVHNVNVANKPISLKTMGSWNFTATSINVNGGGISNIPTIGGFILGPSAYNMLAGAQYRIYGVI